jgi:hypothetical protein
MADDRLDDAIDAVVRAVDRIERATRGQRVIDAADPAGIADAEIERELRPPASGVAPGRDAWEPDPDAPVVGVRKKDKGKKKKRLAAQAIAEAAPIEPDPLEVEAEPQAPEAFDEPAAAAPAGGGAPLSPAAPVIPAAGVHAPAEVHELVGRIVARTQELDDQLEAARRLRGEITELVARLAAAATHQR